jgi:hypothetical protein
MADGAGQVSLAETHPAVDEERIVRIARLAGGRDGRRVSKLIAGANTNSLNVLRGLKGRPLLLASVGNDESVMEFRLSFSIGQQALLWTSVHRLINSLFVLISAPLGGSSRCRSVFLADLGT